MNRYNAMMCLQYTSLVMERVYISATIIGGAHAAPALHGLARFVCKYSDIPRTGVWCHAHMHVHVHPDREAHSHLVLSHTQSKTNLSG